MAKRPNPQRAQRAAQKNRRMNLATALICIGFLAEVYLLLFNRFFVNGTLDQVVWSANYLEVMRWVGLAIAAAGGVLLALRRRKAPLFARLGGALLGLGAFLAFSSFLMLRIYPGGSTAMCIFVPVATILGIVFLLYPPEFAIDALALSGAITALYLLNHGLDKPGWSLFVRAAAVLAIAALAAIALCVRTLRRRGGALREGTPPVFGAGANYALLYGVLALCCAAVLAGLLIPGAAFYGIWALALALFALAVYYTVKMM